MATTYSVNYRIKLEPDGRIKVHRDEQPHIYVLRMGFVEEFAYKKWAEDLREINNKLPKKKDVVSPDQEIKDDIPKNKEFVTPDQYKSYVFAWLALCHYFLRRWGHERVPIHIKRAVHDFEDGFRLIRTVFGEDVGKFYPMIVPYGQPWPPKGTGPLDSPEYKNVDKNHHEF